MLFHGWVSAEMPLTSLGVRTKVSRTFDCGMFVDIAGSLTRTKGFTAAERSAAFPSILTAK